MRIATVISLLFSTMLLAEGQGTFLYDQQSATSGIASFGGSINSNQPTGQSFTPTFNSVGFVQLQLRDGVQTPDVAVTVAVNLWADSIGGAFLDSTQPVSLPGGFAGSATFVFSNPVSVAAGTAYYLQPVIVGGGDDFWLIMSDFYDYPGGTLFTLGQPQASGLDAWFREGVVVPEPSAIVMLGLGLAILFYARWVHFKHCPLF